MQTLPSIVPLVGWGMHTHIYNTHTYTYVHALLRFRPDIHNFEHVYKSIFLCFFLSKETIHRNVQYLQSNLNLLSPYTSISTPAMTSICSCKAFPNKASASPQSGMHTKQELQKHVLLTHKAMAKPKGYPELPWELLGKRLQKPESNIYSKYSGVFVAHISGHRYKKVLNL